MFVRFFDEGLAQCSFLIGDDRAHAAVVVDPRRDVAIYLDAARQAGVTITHAIETHVHADFVSGARELAAAGATVIAGPGSGLQFPFHEARDGEPLQIGDTRLTFVHTPGHTPEHIAVLCEQPGLPPKLLTGDLLFVGGVGRPDLLGADAARQLAFQLHDSLFTRVLALDDGVEVHPGHGAGSLCGAGIGKEPSSTIGQERRLNPMLQHRTRDAFVEAVLSDLPDTPPYFARMKRVNHDGPAVLGLSDGPPQVPPIAPTAAAALIADGALLIDLRGADAFCAGFPDGAINLGFGSKVGYWAGWVVAPDVPIILLADDDRQIREAATQLRRVGLDRIEGSIAGGFAAWARAGLPTGAIDQLGVAELHQRLDAGEPLHVVDVRSAREWRGGHIAGSRNIPVGELPDRAGEISSLPRIHTICEGGYRSTLAASLLARHSSRPVVNVTGGMAGWRRL